jgi:hypothetical protein
MDPADRISENEEAVREQLLLLFLLALVSVSLFYSCDYQIRFPEPGIAFTKRGGINYLPCI